MIGAVRPMAAEQAGNPVLSSWINSPNLQGQEVRFRAELTLLESVITTGTMTGAVNGMIGGTMPPSIFVTLFNLFLQVVFAGQVTGAACLLVFASRGSPHAPSGACRRGSSPRRSFLPTLTLCVNRLRCPGLLLLRSGLVCSCCLVAGSPMARFCNGWPVSRLPTRSICSRWRSLMRCARPWVSPRGWIPSRPAAILG